MYLRKQLSHVFTCLCRFFDVEKVLLPEIRSSAELYGTVKEGPLKGLPISGVLGDQQAALVGQMCFNTGQAKNTLVIVYVLIYLLCTQVVTSLQCCFLLKKVVLLTRN